MKPNDRHRPPEDRTHGPDGETPAPGPGPQINAGGGPETSDLRKQVDAKAAECKELIDQLQRLAAEYSNYQKRMERVIQDEKRQAVRNVVLDLLPAIDNFERALAAARAEASFEALLQGVTLAHDLILAGLARHGVTPIDAAGQHFDPEHHEAVALIPSESHPQGKVVEEMLKGYRQDGRTIRPSRVAVSGGPAAAEGQGEPPPDGEPYDEGAG